MHTQTRTTTVTFARPFALDGFEKVLPPGVYRVESENDILDGIFLPDCLRTPVRIHLHSTPGSPAYAQTVTVPWQDLEAAQLRDRRPAATPTEPGFEEMLLEPSLRVPVHSDGVPETNVRDAASDRTNGDMAGSSRMMYGRTSAVPSG